MLATWKEETLGLLVKITVLDNLVDSPTQALFKEHSEQAIGLIPLSTLFPIVPKR